MAGRTESHYRLLNLVRRQEMNFHRSRTLDDAHRAMQTRCIGDADPLNRIPILAECLGLSWSEIGKVRLIVCINAGHQLDVRTVMIRETTIPRIPEFMVSPCPLLLAGSDVMVGYMQNSRVGGVIVAAEEILARVHDHVARGDRNVAIPAQIVRRIAAVRPKVRGLLLYRNAVTRPFAIVNPVVHTETMRELGDGPLGVIGYVANIFGEE